MRRLVAAMLLGLLAAPAVAQPALTLPVTAPTEAGPVRLDLPAQVLAASRSMDLADLRLLDSTGRTLAMIRLPTPATEVTARHPLVPLPVLGRAGTLDDARLTLRIDAATGLRVAELEGALRPDAAPATLALLFDTRELPGAAVALRLEGDIPVGQPVRMLVEASADLARWTPVGAQTLFRPDRAAALAPVALDGSAVRGRYLRLRWEADTALLSPVGIRSAELETRTGAARLPLMAALPAEAVGRGRSFAMTLPTRAPLVGVRIRPEEPGLVVPVRILGRARADDPWQELGRGTAVRQPGSGESSLIPLQPGPTGEVQVEAMGPGEGFPTPPSLEVALAPAALLFVGSGQPPYRLTIGALEAEPAWVPDTALADVLAGRRLEDLPTARVADAPAVVAATAVGGKVPSRTLWLWGALAAGTLALAAMAWRLARG